LLCAQVLEAQRRAEAAGVAVIIIIDPTNGTHMCSTTEAPSDETTIREWVRRAYAVSPEPAPTIPPPRDPGYDIVILGSPINHLAGSPDGRDSASISRVLRGVRGLARKHPRVAAAAAASSWWPTKSAAASPPTWSTVAFVYIHASDPTFMPPWHGYAQRYTGTLVRYRALPVAWSTAPPTRQSWWWPSLLFPGAAQEAISSSEARDAFEALSDGSSVAGEVWLRHAL
jgi:hypothetical protein